MSSIPSRLSGVLEGLDEIDRSIIEMRYGVGDQPPLSTTEISLHLRVPVEKVREREIKALRRLRWKMH